ncbi:MAG: rRNA maturation RNase YbeY [Clostridia bacterium]|nr:rRNA maturation RNase YbeY [Clostridia bacterium]
MANLKIECSKRGLNLTEIASAVYKTLGQTDNLKAELVFLEAEQMRELNASSRGVDKVTDVLSFPTLDGIREKVLSKKEHPFDVEGARLMLGSIVLCNQKVKEQAEEYGHSEERERTYLIVHGLMHLFGYDHMTDSDKKQMREKEKTALAELGINE